MTLTPKLRLIFEHVDARRSSRLRGPVNWRFAATVDGTSIGDATEFPMVARSSAALEESVWTHEVDVSAANSIDIRFSATAVRDVDTQDLGTVRWTMRFPFAQTTRVLTNAFFAVTVRVELAIEDTFGPHDPTALFACRTVAGVPIWSTVAGRRFVTRLEFCEVRPTPSASSLPPRPSQPRGAPAGDVRNGRGRRVINPGDAINTIANPSVIPVLAAADATLTTAARIEYTYYRPAMLAFTEKDPRLVWSQRSLSGGAAVAFVDDPNGLVVHCYGTTEGEVLLECSMEGVVLASYRALVRPMKDIICRFNILNGPPGARPRATPDHVLAHLQVTNVLLRQAGLQLTLDTDATCTDGAVTTTIPGIFRIAVSAGVTSGILPGNNPRCTRLNYRPGIMNFAYIVSSVHPVAGMFVLGEATDIPLNTLAPRVTDNGTPSTSWKRPSGIAPDRAARAVNMRLFNRTQRAGHPQLYGMYVTDSNGNPANANDRFTYAGTIAHELGHILGLRHRVGAGHDGLLHPWSENLMHGTNPTTIAQDIDIIQAKAVVGSPAVT